MKFCMHIAFPILTFHHQNFTRYHVHLVRQPILYENNFRLLCYRTTTSNKLNRSKTLVLVAYDRKNI